LTTTQGEKKEEIEENYANAFYEENLAEK